MISNLMTTSRAKCLGSCPRKHYYQYEIGVRPVIPSRALRVGTAVHELLHLLKTGAWPNGREEVLATLDGMERMLADVLVTCYDWRWAEDPLKVMASEYTYRLPLRAPGQNAMRDWRVAGQIDGIVEWRGHLVVLEHKTTCEDITPGSQYWRRVRMDLQCSNYYAAAKELGYEVEGVLYDVMRKPLLTQHKVPMYDGDGYKVVLDKAGNRVLNANGKPRQTGDSAQGFELQSRLETEQEWFARVMRAICDDHEKYYQRVMVHRLNLELEEASRDNAGFASMVKHYRKCGNWPRNTSACADFGGCPYFEVCANGLDLRDHTQIPEGFVQVDDLHPELKG